MGEVLILLSQGHPGLGELTFELLSAEKSCEMTIVASFHRAFFRAFVYSLG